MATLLLFSTALLITSCGGDESGDGNGAGGQDNSGPMTYTVKLVNPDGTGAQNIVVQVLKDGAQVTLARVDTEGKVSFTLDKGDYELGLILVGAGAECTYDPDSLKISADSAETVIQFYNAPGGASGDSFKSVSAGHYFVELGSDEFTYFIFTAEQRGIYELYAEADGQLLDIGYYGSPLNPLSYNLADKADGKISLTIRKMNLASDTMAATPYLIGIKGAGADSAILHIVRTDAVLEYTPQESEWIDYTPTKAPTPQLIGYDNVDATLTDLDITNPDLRVVLGSDGYYHLDSADGPLVYVRISISSMYIASFKDINEAGQLCRYFYDGDAFLRKEHYVVAMNAYIAAADVKTGLYPLDEGLKYIIQNTGEHLGWWKENSMNYIFYDVNEVRENAWLFACCTAELSKTGADSSSPITMNEEGKLRMSAGETVYMTYTAAAGESVTFSALPEGASVTVNGTTVTPTAGKVTVTFAAGVNSISITLGDGDSDSVIKYKLD